MILTLWGYLLLSLSGLALCLFCWLSYSSIKGAAGRQKAPRVEVLRDAHDITGSPLPRF